MNVEPGEIYFIREREDAERLTPFVKIGLVRDSEDRDSFSRLTEHQTGNPRRLHLEEANVVRTPAVDYVEALLHRHFALSRVSGEWFEFATESDQAAAIAQTRAFAAEVELLVPIFAKAEALLKRASNGSTVEPSDEDLATGLALVTAKAQGSVYEGLQEEITRALRVEKERGGDVSAVAVEQVREYKPKLQPQLVKEHHPALWERFQVRQVRWDHRFNVAMAAPDEGSLGEECAAITEEVRSMLAQVRRRADVARLIEPSLRLRRMQGMATWSRDVAQAKLQVSLGEAEVLRGICTWKRQEKVSLKFDSEAFALAHPKLAVRYLSKPEKRSVLITKKMKAKLAPAKSRRPAAKVKASSTSKVTSKGTSKAKKRR